MIELIRTDSHNPDFVALVSLLDAELAILDGEDHAFYAQYNKITHIRHVVIACQGNQAVGCGAIKALSPEIIEVKRMYVRPEYRNKGIAARILTELETWAEELSATRCILETGIRQPDAIRLYEKQGYRKIPNYGQYADMENSVCFAKDLAR